MSVALRTSDGVKINVDPVVARFIFKNSDKLNEGKVTYLDNINSVILQIIIKWATQNKPQEEKEADKEKKADDLQGICDVTQEDPGTLFELILAANHLNFQELRDLTCETVAKMLKGKSPEEIRDKFKIKKDFSVEEEQQIRKENEWCEEK